MTQIIPPPNIHTLPVTGALLREEGVTTMSLTLLLDGCGNPTWSQVGANWSCHIFYGELAPWGVPWHPRHNTSQWPFYGLRPYPSFIGLFGQFPLHQPPDLHLLFWAGGAPYGSYGPWAVIHGPRSIGHSGPFWPNSMRPKGASQVGPKQQLGPPQLISATISLDTKVTKNLMDTILGINPIGPIFGHGPPWTNSSAMASGNHQISS
ncbi:hypothetical protein O181_053964, partial [Austropuccinia psidii MF-1]|nr:hypothetical protein [Austropuccinia psidii MF-1]